MKTKYLYEIYVQKPSDFPCDYRIPVWKLEGESDEDTLKRALSRAKYQHNYDVVTLTELATGKIIYEKSLKK